MKISNFIEYLTPLLANFNNTDTDPNVSNLYHVLSLNFFAPYNLEPTSLAKHSKTFIDNIFLNSVEFNTFSGNLTSQISDHLPKFLILKDFYHKILINSNNVFEQNDRFSIMMNLKMT